jgi:hypothetical protein
MAGTSLLALLDDIAAILDDVAVLTKVATQKTVGVLGDDLALNAEQVSGVEPRRELPVVWAVAKGSLVNKLVLVPSALAISALIPWAVTPLLMAGGAFLCFEGCEKVTHKLLHAPEAKAGQAALAAALADPAADVVALERHKVKGAIRTDFILSAEIIVIALGTVSGSSFGMRLAVLSAVAALMTVGVYGLVAGIVKLDDAGLHLSRSRGAGAGVKRALGRAVLAGSPYLMKLLSIAGTLAMFLVGGGILVHGLPPLHHASEALTARANALAAGLGLVAPSLLGALVGLLIGGLLLGIVEAVKRIVRRVRAPATTAPP